MNGSRTKNFCNWRVYLLVSSNQTVFKTKFQKPNEGVLGLTADPVRKTYWVYTNQSLFELDPANENRDIWKIYLEKGKFETALKYTKVTLLTKLFITLSSLTTWHRRQAKEIMFSLPKPRHFSTTVSFSRLHNAMHNARLLLKRSL